MKDCLIMGFGRSGTSMMGGILHQAGYFLGDDLYPPRESNPKGFFENAFINGINERILAAYDYVTLHKELPRFNKTFSPYRPGYGHRWLSYIPPDVYISLNDNEINDDISEALHRTGFAYKDPRFNYTLNVWMKKFKTDPLFICMFREPEITIKSVIMECQNAEYLSDFYVDDKIVELIWQNSYRHLLRTVKNSRADNFLFIHYKQLISGAILPYLSERLNIELSSSFVDQNLNRTRNYSSVERDTQIIYQRLCELANFNA